MKEGLVVLLLLSILASVNCHGPNLIVNGNFCRNECKWDWCIFNHPGGVTGWSPKPEIEIGFGYVYNHRLGSERVIELDPNYNSCIEQVIYLQRGNYELRTQFIARDGRALQDCQFAIKLNNRELKHITPWNYNLNTDYSHFNV